MKWSNKSNFFRWWFVSELPDVHCYLSDDKKHDGRMSIFKLYFRRLLVHPVKRRISKYYLIFLKKYFGLTVIAITGSSGKTSTKEMLFSILKNRKETIETFENIDPIYNIPTTILKCKPSTKYLILEMGVEYPGEMDFYLWLAKPDIGVITNIYPTHTQYLENVRGVFDEKSKLARGLTEKGYAILNAEDRYIRKLKDKIKARIVWFGEKSMFQVSSIKLDEKGTTEFLLTFKDDNESIKINLPVLGGQFVNNALAASTVAKVLGYEINDIKKGLENYIPQKHRMNVFRLRSGALIIDDTYNNNPNAAKISLKTFSDYSFGKKKIIVFGDMLELGTLEKKYHKEIAEYISNIFDSNLEKVICVGISTRETSKILSRTIKVSQAQNWNEALTLVRPFLKNNYSILVKGSRSIGLDKLVDELLKSSY